MAELTGRSFEREPTPILSRKAIKKDLRGPDQFAGDKAFSEAEVWKATRDLTSEVAKIFGSLENDREQAVVDDIKAKIETEFFKNDELALNHVPKIDATNLNPHKLMSDFHGNGLKTEEGVITIKPLAEYEGYEDLSFKFKREVDKYFNTSKETTQANVVKQLAALSKAHRKLSLDKESMLTWQETSRILSDSKSWNKKTDIAPYLKKFLAEGGQTKLEKGAWRGQSQEYKKFIFNRIRNGFTDIPGAPGGKAKPSDIGVKSGLTEDAKKRVNHSLNRFSDKVFEAVNNSSIDLEDAESMINKNMQLILHSEFINHLSVNEDAAIAKAKIAGYEYIREFDGLYGGKGTIKYILAPKTLRSYIEAWDRKDKTPKQDEIYYAQVENRLKALKGQFDISERTKRYLKDPDLTHHARAKLILIMGTEFRSEEQRSEIEDSNSILNEIERYLIDDVEYMDNFGTVDKNGLFHPHADSKIRKMIPDREDEVKVWVDEGTKGGPGLGGRLEAQVNIVKGKNRKGVEYLLKNKHKLHDLYKTYESKTRAMQKNLMDSNVERQMDNHDSILGLLDDYASADTDWKRVDGTKIDKMWNSKDSLERFMVRGAFQNRAEFERWAIDVVTKANKSPAYNKTIPSRLIPGHDDNDLALETAITDQMSYDMKTYINRGVNVPKDTITKPLTTPIQALLKKMREAANNQELDFKPEQKERIKLYEQAHEALIMIGTNYKRWDTLKLKAQSLKILNKGENIGETVTYWRNKTFADHIRAELEVRMVELNSGELGALVLTRELREGKMWQNEYGDIWDDSKPELDNINNFLRFLGHELQGRDSRGKEVQYFGHGELSNHLLTLMKKRTQIVPEIAALDRKVQSTKEALMNRLVSQPQPAN